MPNVIYGYARCSTNEARQDINRQKRELQSLGVTELKNIYWEYASGIKSDRPELQKLLEVIQAGDTIVTTEVSRLTRSTRDLCEILNMVQERHICLVIGTFVVDCRQDILEPMTRGMIMMWGVFSEMERELIRQRVKSGIENARSRGRKIGRPRTEIENLSPKFLQYLSLFNAGKINITEYARLVGCSRTTIYSYLRIINEK